MRSLFLSLLCFVFSCSSKVEKPPKTAYEKVIVRTFGETVESNFVLRLEPEADALDKFNIRKEKDKIIVSGSSPVALCRGVYDYIKKDCKGIVSWSGNRIPNLDSLPSVQRSVQSPYEYRYYFNVVTHGYTTAYWDWERWEKEIDWMALHGINMPLIGGAQEAILYRVFTKMGLKEEEIKSYFSGPAHFPWNRMGNLNGWDGPVPKSYYKKQIALTHKILKRMKALEMSPIVHAFAGFVPSGMQRLHPDLNLKELGWGGGLPLQYNGYILPPDSPLFEEIGAMYIQEWEREFGKGEYYLADSFNEMDVPISKDPNQALGQLAGYGKSVYNSIKKGNPEAVWVMQGWTFPFHRDADGALFWTPERLEALVSEVPDEQLLILDLANEYNHDFWKIDPSWKIYEGFFGKKWIYSFIPNMGGKTALNGKLDTYASIPFEALQYTKKQNLVGFGFAPEGIENNEMVYELLSDVAWENEPITLGEWMEQYCLQRYGAYPDKMREAMSLLHTSVYGSFTDHPMFRYQFRPYPKPEGVEDHATVHHSGTFDAAVGAFLSCSDQFKGNTLYTADAIDLVTQYMGLKVDQQLLAFLAKKDGAKPLEESLEYLLVMDGLLASHPNRGLEEWTEFARKWGDTKKEKAYYESNAKRLITTWGGDPVNDYSGRVWSGLLRDYYIPRWRRYHADTSSTKKQNMRDWEEKWILTPGVSEPSYFEDPVQVALSMFKKLEAEK